MKFTDVHMYTYERVWATKNYLTIFRNISTFAARHFNTCRGKTVTNDENDYDDESYMCYNIIFTTASYRKSSMSSSLNKHGTGSNIVVIAVMVYSSSSSSSSSAYSIQRWRVGVIKLSSVFLVGGYPGGLFVVVVVVVVV